MKFVITSCVALITMWLARIPLLEFKMAIHDIPRYEQELISAEQLDQHLDLVSAMLLNQSSCAVDTLTQAMRMRFAIKQHEVIRGAKKRVFTKCEFSKYLKQQATDLDPGLVHIWIVNLEHDPVCSVYDFEGFYQEVHGVKHICLNRSSISPQLIIHELGHAFGLVHPWEDEAIQQLPCGYEGEYGAVSCKNFMNIGTERCYFLPVQAEAFQEEVKRFLKGR